MDSRFGRILKEFRESYHNATGKASDLARNTNYSLIAIIWVLCGQDLNKVSSYRCVLIWLLLSLAIDYVHYLIMALFGTIKYRYEESKVKDKSKIDETPTKGYPEITPYLTTFPLPLNDIPSSCLLLVKVVALATLLFASAVLSTFPSPTLDLVMFIFFVSDPL